MVNKINRITAKGVKGIYKDGFFEVHVGSNSEDTKIFINGKQLKSVQSIHISMKLDKPTVMTIEKLKEED